MDAFGRKELNWLEKLLSCAEWLLDGVLTKHTKDDYVVDDISFVPSYECRLQVTPHVNNLFFFTSKALIDVYSVAAQLTKSRVHESSEYRFLFTSTLSLFADSSGSCWR